MALEVREILWGSACGIADLVEAHAAAPLSAPIELEVQLNGAALPHVARYYAGIMASGHLPADARILDLGCGYGRIAMALAQHLGDEQRYVGLDPNADAIEWAQQHVSPLHPGFSFERMDVRSLPYNPDGQLSGSDFRFPFDDGSLDLVFMVSVLTHVDLPTLEAYVHEASRTLKPETGRLVSTIFLLDDEVDALIANGRSSFRFPWPHGPSRVENPGNPELAIAHPRQLVLDLLADAGFAQVQVCNGHWSGRSAPPLDYQDLLVADRRSGVAYDHGTEARPSPQPGGDHFPVALLDRIDAERFGSRDALLAFVGWAASLTVNALWWQEQGWALVIVDDEQLGGADPALNFTAFGKLGIEKHMPANDPAEPRFRPLDDASIVDLLCQAGCTADAHGILRCIIEAMGNGFRVVDAARAGKSLVLSLTNGSTQAAPIPLFSGVAKVP